MLGKVRIVTDSSAQFMDPSVIQRYNITVVPLRIKIGSEIYREGIDIDSHNFFRRVAESKSAPVLLPPDEQQFAQVYARLNRETDRILSLHISRDSAWQMRDCSRRFADRFRWVSAAGRSSREDGGRN